MLHIRFPCSIQLSFDVHYCWEEGHVSVFVKSCTLEALRSVAVNEKELFCGDTQQALLSGRRQTDRFSVLQGGNYE